MTVAEKKEPQEWTKRKLRKDLEEIWYETVDLVWKRSGMKRIHSAFGHLQENSYSKMLYLSITSSDQYSGLLRKNF